MTLSVPKKILFLVALLLAVVSILGHFISIPIVTGHQFWFMAGATLLLFIGIAWKGF